MSEICLPALVPVAPRQQGDDRSIWRIWHFQLQISGWKMKTQTLQQTPKDLSSDWIMNHSLWESLELISLDGWRLNLSGTMGASTCMRFVKIDHSGFAMIWDVCTQWVQGLPYRAIGPFLAFWVYYGPHGACLVRVSFKRRWKGQCFCHIPKDP